MIFLRYRIVLVIIILIITYGCETRTTEHYSNGEVKGIIYCRFNSKNPYRKNEFSEEGKLIGSMEFDKDGCLLYDWLLNPNGDSIVSSYSNNERYSHSITYTQRGDVYYFPYESKKLTGVVRYYKKGKLFKRALYIQDSVIAVEFNNRLEKGRRITVKEFTNNNKVHEKVFVNKDFNIYVSQYLINADHQLFPSGTYFKSVKLPLIDTVHGDYVLMDLPDTLKRGGAVKGNVLWNHWKKKDLYLEYYMNEVDGYPQNSLQGKSLKSTTSKLNFQFKVEEPGYHFLSGHAILRNKDSSIYQDFIIYDDFYVSP